MIKIYNFRNTVMLFAAILLCYPNLAWSQGLVFLGSEEEEAAEEDSVRTPPPSRGSGLVFITRENPPARTVNRRGQGGRLFFIVFQCVVVRNNDVRSDAISFSLRHGTTIWKSSSLAPNYLIGITQTSRNVRGRRDYTIQVQRTNGDEVEISQNDVFEDLNGNEYKVECENEYVTPGS